jgi:hypothetical protein
MLLAQQWIVSECVCVCVCVCVCARVRACVRARGRALARVIPDFCSQGIHSTSEIGEKINLVYRK